MRIILLTILFTMLFVPTISANPKDINEPGIKGIDLVFDMQFEQANKIFDEMIRMDPENAYGLFFKIYGLYSGCMSSVLTIMIKSIWKNF